MQKGLARFAGRLRQSGIRVSPGEVLDAARILLADARAGGEDLAGRDLLRETLRLALVKRRGDFARFDAAFDAHFASPAGAGKGRRRRRGRGAAGGEPGGGGGGSSRSAQGEVSGRPASGPEIAPRFKKLKTARPPRRGAPPAKGRGEAPEEEERQAAISPEAAAAAWAERLLEKPSGAEEEPGRKAGREEFPCPVSRPPGRARSPRAPGVRLPVERKDFRGRWAADEEGALAEAIERELLRLRMRRVRRRRLARRGSLWVQRALRLAVGTDGVPMRLPRRRPRRREPRLLLLVDVSGSVARAAAAFLALSARLGESFRHLTAYFFVDAAVEATPLVEELERSRPGRAALERAAARLPGLNLQALSDTGRALYQVYEREGERLRRETLVLILGDGRNNGLDPCAWALGGLRARARRVVWLVPEPVSSWGTGDSDLRAYAPHCDLMAEAADLESLRWGLRRAGGRWPRAEGPAR